MRVELYIFRKDSIFFAAHGYRYHVCYVENSTGIVVLQEFFNSKAELKLKFAVRNIEILADKCHKGWPEPGGCKSMCLVLDR